MNLTSIIRIAEALDEADVPFLVVGGVAVAAHGYGRSTQDLDLVVRLEPATVRRAFRALSSLGYNPVVPVTADEFADRRRREKLVADKGMTVLHFHSDRQPETPIDLFASEPFDFPSEYEAALVEQLAPERRLRILRLGTLIRLKRQAARPQDLADVAELLRIHGDAIDG